MADEGNPRYAAPWWEGVYALSPTEGVVMDDARAFLTRMLQIQFFSNAMLSTYTHGETFLTLPEGIRPKNAMVLPIAITDTSGHSLAMIGINPDGTCQLNIDASDTTVVWLTGIQPILVNTIYGGVSFGD